MKYIIIIITAIVFQGCAVKKAANDIEGAKKHIKNANATIMNQIERYPSLVDNAFTSIKTDTIYIPGDSIILNNELQNFDSLNQIQQDYYSLEDTYEVALSMLQNFKTKDKDLFKTKKLLNIYKLKTDSIFNKYVSQSKLINQIGVQEKNAFKLHYKIVNGKLTTKAILKPNWKLINTTETTNKIKIKDSFWQDEKFYLFLLGLLALIYFLGDLLKEILHKVVDTMINLFKKIFKII